MSNNKLRDALEGVLEDGGGGGGERPHDDGEDEASPLATPMSRASRAANVRPRCYVLYVLCGSRVLHVLCGSREVTELPILRNLACSGVHLPCRHAEVCRARRDRRQGRCAKRSRKRDTSTGTWRP